MPIVGDVLAGRYRIDAPIGAGGMASVYRARDLRLDRDVAVKVLLPNLAADPTLAQRFEREALALAATAHPSVVKIFDVEPGDPATGREPFYVMELCEGGSLADRLTAGGRLEPDEIVPVIAAIADGLADLHRRGFVHRDVKPHNILFDQERPMLADFGLARPEERSGLDDLTVSGSTVGTLAYLAPELLRAAPATPGSDVFALGVVTFQALTGRLPWPAASIGELVSSHAEPAPTLSSVVPGLGSAFDAPLAAALAIDPPARPAPLEFAQWLTAAQDAPRPHALGVVPAAVPVTPAADPAADTGAVTLDNIRTDVANPGSDGVRSRAGRPGGPRPAMVALGIAGLVLFAVIALSSLLGGGNGGPPAGTTSPGVPASPDASVPPTLVPTSPSAPSPTPAPVPASEARAALDRIDAAIEGLAGESGLRDRDLDALRRRAAEVRSAVEAGDRDAALNRTARLADEVDRVDDRVEGDAMDRLKDEVSQLDEAIAAG
jgi:serine/threonine-protein kinase